jgi:hypothetical protein
VILTCGGPGARAPGPRGGRSPRTTEETRGAGLDSGVQAFGPAAERPAQKSVTHTMHQRWGVGKTGNDPSAGSPTETLLRLLLPLNDKVRTASRGTKAGEPATEPQSGGLTGSFNR